MQKQTSKTAYALAALIGLVLWIVTAATSGRSEPWDAPGYWTIAYPLAVLLCGVLGFLYVESPWRWAVTLMLMQALVMAFGADFTDGFGLLPIGLIFLAILCLPAVAAAQVGAWIGRWSKKR